MSSFASLIPEHQLATSTTPRGRDTYENVAACSCGQVFTWYGREEEHARHVLDVVRAQARTEAVASTTRKVKASDLTSGDVIVGRDGGTSMVDDVEPSTNPLLVVVETEHGTLSLPRDEDVTILDDK